jgi:hypothetical protein
MEYELVVIIPARAEKDLELTLSSLTEATPPTHSRLRILVHINAAENDRKDVFLINRQNEEVVSRFKQKGFEVSQKSSVFPSKKAGVGLARKLAMDHAISTSTHAPQRIALINLDADCTVSSNYFTAIEEAHQAGVKAASIRFEHPVPHIHMSRYELLLRYQVNGYRWVGLPGAFHTIGSSFFVNGQVYQSVGGMNSRKAGEDFYFLHKVMAQTEYHDLVQPVVYPSDRISWRVPFGTGKALDDLKYANTNQLYAYNPQSFLSFQSLYRSAMKLIGSETYNTWESQLSAENAAIAERMQVASWWEDATNHSSTVESAKKRFKQRFYGFNVIKFMHLYRDLFFINVPVENAAAALWRLWFGSNQNLPDTRAETLLTGFRSIDSRQTEISAHSWYPCR